VLSSVAGVDLYETLDPYDPVVRSIKYAVLFIVMSFAAFFLFDVRSGVRIHPVSYLLVGAALALFYLLLLSLTEQIGFVPAYLIAALLTVSLVSGYSAAMLRDGKRAIPVALLLSLLYGYLYFVLQLEDYALLFGAFLLFAFLAFLMFATRKIDWFELDGRGRSAE
jgi:inner membrane protein